jgi:hypothetical protein
MTILMIIVLILAFVALISNAGGHGTTLFLGAVALSAPYIVELLKKKYYAPDLQIEFKHNPPYSRQSITRAGWLAYYSQFCVENKGKSPAKSCEAILEELWLSNSRGKFVKEKNFLPVNLEWAIYHQQPGGHLIKTIFENIKPDGKKYCGIGHIRHLNDSSEKSVFYRDKPEHKFFLDVRPKLHAQPDCILPGKAKIKIGVYAANAPKIERNFVIKWSGNWKDEEEDMLKEIKIFVQGEENGKE